MARALMRDAEAVGADTLVIDCPACFERMHLAQGGMVTALKIVDLMELAIPLFAPASSLQPSAGTPTRAEEIPAG